MEWENKDCSFVGCADRKKQASLFRQLASVTEERNQLHTMMETLKDTLKDREQGLKSVIQDLLKGVSITEGGKVVAMEDIHKKVDEIAKKIDDDKVSGIVQKNLELQNQVHQLTLQLISSENNSKEMREQLSQLQIAQKVREEKDIQIIRETSQAQSKMTDIVKQKDDLELEVRKLDMHKQAIQQDIAEARVEAEGIYRSYDEKLKLMQKIKEDTDFYRKEFGTMKKKIPLKMKYFLMPKLERAIKYFQEGNQLKARKLWIQIQTMHLKLSDGEKRLITREYDQLLRLMGGAQ